MSVDAAPVPCPCPVELRVFLSGDDWMCDGCGESVPSPQAQAFADAPVWFEPLAARVERWISEHPGKPYPVPAWAQEIAAANPGSVARVLLTYLETRGVQVEAGDFPPALRRSRPSQPVSSSWQEATQSAQDADPG